jgi:hypothetical protein
MERILKLEMERNVNSKMERIEKLHELRFLLFEKIEVEDGAT